MHDFKIFSAMRRKVWASLFHQKLMTIACCAILCLSFFWLRMPSNGLVATYYDNIEWRGTPIFSTVESQINLETFTQAIAQRGFPKEQISIAWNGWIRIDQTANYRFITESDDGSSVMIDDQLVVDNGGFHGLHRAKGEITLNTGMHRITISYFNGSGMSRLLVLWRDSNNRTTSLPSEILFSRPLSKDLEFLSRHWTAFSWFYLLVWGFACAIILKALEKHLWYKLGTALFCGMMIFMVLETLPWLPGKIILRMKTPLYSPLPEIIFRADAEDSSERMTFRKKEGAAEFTEYTLPLPAMPIISFQLDPKIQEFEIQSLTIQTATTYDKWVGNDLQTALQSLRNVQTSYDAEKNVLKGHALGSDDPSLSFQHPIPNENRMPRLYAIAIACGLAFICLLTPIFSDNKQRLEQIGKCIGEYILKLRIVESLILIALYMCWHGWDDLSMTIDTSIGVRLGRVGLLLVCLSGYHVMLAKLLPYPIEMFPLITIAGIMIGLYLAAFFNGLLYVGYGLFIVGIILFIIFWGLRLWRHGKLTSSLSDYVTPGMGVWLVIMILSYLYHDSAMLSTWDEFSLWGIYPKEIFLQNGLPDPVYSAIMHRNYPPALGYFQYFVASILGYAEGHLIFAQSLHLIAGVIALLSGLKWKAISKLLVIGTLGYFFLSIADLPFSAALRSSDFFIIFSSLSGICLGGLLLKKPHLVERGVLLIAFVVTGYWGMAIYGGLPISLYADIVVGTYFGSIPALYFISTRQRAKGTFSLVFPLLFVLPLIKPIGLYLAIFAIMVILADQALLALKKFRQPDMKQPMKRAWKPMLLMFGMLLMPLVSQATWTSYLRHGQFDNPHQVNFTLQDIARSFSPERATENDKTVIHEFISYLSAPRLIGNLFSLTYWQVILAGYGLIPIGINLLVGRRSLQGRRYLLANMAMCLCWGLYLAIHLLVYLYLPMNPTSNLPSFDRYLAIYLIGWLLFVLAVNAHLLTMPFKPKWAAIGVVILIIGALTYHAPQLPGSAEAAFYSQTRMDIARLTAEVSQHIPVRAKVYLIWQGTAGFEFCMMRYELAPRYTQVKKGFSLGKPYQELASIWGKDAFTVNYTILEWAKILQDYDYVVICHADDQFWNTYGSLFEQREKKVYRIVKLSAETVVLKPIE